MMLFLAKSAVCIGFVAAAASGVGAFDAAAALGGGARQAADAAGQACLRSSACARAGAEALTLAAGSAGSVPAPHPAKPSRAAARSDP